MPLTKLMHYAKRITQLGPLGSFTVLKNRVQKKRFYGHWKHRAERKTANHVWEMIACKYSLNQSFPLFFAKIKRNSAKFFPADIFLPFEYDAQIHSAADKFVKKTFDLLGSGPVSFSTIPWHADFRLHAQNPSADHLFEQGRFYQDITVEDGRGEEFCKDIKVPWELSRCYHFSVLGQAYSETKKQIYADAFVQQASDWMRENPFMLGVNWLCPMEVGIRAVNWVCAFYYFKDAPSISTNFWQDFVCSLYDHLFYLENNWEIDDSRTSNHYLSDLIGYFYLCFFFHHLPGIAGKKNWCYTEIVREFGKQVFHEGADYEGSTAYHRLVTEIFYLFSALCEKNSLDLSDDFKHKLARMFLFIDWCTPHDGQMVIIGDDGSGRVLYHGITQELVDSFSTASENRTKQFRSFGLSVIKTKKWHVTLRHHAYKKNQPSGHFHNDAASITLSVNGTPLFVDPGSFVYTSSAQWRNRFRSVAAHNTFYLEGVEPVPFDDRFFALNLPEGQVRERIGELQCKTRYDLYEDFGLEADRSISLDQEKNSLTIVDYWEASCGFVGNFSSPIKGCWNMTLAPDIVAVHVDDCWQFTKDGTIFARLRSDDLTFALVDGWVAPCYGTSIATKRLRASAPIVLRKKTHLYIF